MINKITNFTYQPTVEGDRIIYTYSEINDNGDIISSNNKRNFIITDSDILECINKIKIYLEQR